MLRSIVVSALLIAACHTPNMAAYRDLYGMDRYTDDDLCMVAPDALTLQHEAQLLAWCEEHGGDHRLYFVVASMEDAAEWAARQGYREGFATVVCMGWLGACRIDIREDMFDTDRWKAAARHEVCHLDGENHSPGKPFRVPDQCPVP